MKSPLKKPMLLIKKIQEIRAKNNVNWMNMLRISYKHDPVEASKIMAKIYVDDQKISKLVKKLVKITNK